MCLKVLPSKVFNKRSYKVLQGHQQFKNNLLKRCQEIIAEHCVENIYLLALVEREIWYQENLREYLHLYRKNVFNNFVHNLNIKNIRAMFEQCAKHMWRVRHEKTPSFRVHLKHFTIFGYAQHNHNYMLTERRKNNDEVSGTIWLIDFSHSSLVITFVAS